MIVGGGTYVSLTPFHIGEPGRMVGQTNNNNKILVRDVILLQKYGGSEGRSSGRGIDGGLDGGRDGRHRGCDGH